MILRKVKIKAYYWKIVSSTQEEAYYDKLHLSLSIIIEVPPQALWRPDAENIRIVNIFISS